MWEKEGIPAGVRYERRCCLGEGFKGRFDAICCWRVVLGDLKRGREGKGMRSEMKDVMDWI